MKGVPVTGPISHSRLIESLKEAAGWPEADRNTVMTLALTYASTRADAEAAAYFADLSGRNPADAVAQALAGFFAVRAGHDLESALSKLDKAAAMEPGLPHYFRGLALAELLPNEGPRQGAFAAADRPRAEQVVSDLEFVLAARDQFPAALLRAAHQGLARAYRALGSRQQTHQALRSSGLGEDAADARPMFTGFSITAHDGMRLSPPHTFSPAPNVHVAQSYDFGDFSLITTSAGIVAIDAGTSPDRVTAAVTDLGLQDDLPVSHLIFTHSHFDHIGGAAALRGPETRILAAAGFAAEAERQSHWNPPFHYLIGTGAKPSFDVAPDEPISEPRSLIVGDTELVLIPVRGGETRDALMVHLPASGLLFVGDAIMPYLGIPFGPEGSAEGLLATMRSILALQPRQLIAGHTTLTENFTIEVLAGVELALTELHEVVLTRINENMPLAEILDLAYVPRVLHDHPASVAPYLAFRETFIARSYHEHTGYWQPSGEGLDSRNQREKAAALDLLAAGDADAFVKAAETLIRQGDISLALELLDPGLIAHPRSHELAELRHRVLKQLMEQRGLLDPFGFLTYAELADAQLAPVG
jgi:glyoxylase-like metal-dependent hydrolase (beta-lactamase superfamily II)